MTDEPPREKTCLWGFRPGLRQTGLYSQRRLIRGLKFRIKEVEGLFYLYVAKTKGLISYVVTMQLSAPFFSLMQRAGFFMMRLK